MTSAWADELAFATDLARRAGALLLDSYERLERIDYKSKRDVVTNADYASERLVIDSIKERFPGDAILAEESGEHAGVLRDDGSHNGRTWVIDPLGDDLYDATDDGPARLDGEPIRASTKETLSDYVVSLAVIGRGGLMRE